MSVGGCAPTEKRQEQLAIIQSEIDAVPHISHPVEPLTHSCRLVRDVAQNAALFTKVLSLFAEGGSSPPYTGIRFARGDGNCFYRSASFSLLEHMLTRPNLAQDFAQLFQELREPLLRQYGDFVQDFCDVAEEKVNAIAKGKLTTVEELHAKATAPDAQYFVYYFRYAVSQYIRDHRDDFLPFVMGYNYENVDDFCSAEVDAIESECDNVQLVAFGRCFGVRIVVEYLDATEGDRPTQHIFCGDNPRDDITIYLLYRPGHYDLLYR